MSGQKKKKRERADLPAKDGPLLDITQVASATECTGILPAQPETERERQQATGNKAHACYEVRS